MRKTCFGLALAGIAFVTPAHATPTTYSFSGQLYQTDPSPNALWQFAPGQAFRGSFTYDAAAITNSQDYIVNPDWELAFYRGAVRDFQFSIDTPEGYALQVPAANIGDTAVAEVR